MAGAPAWPWERSSPVFLPLLAGLPPGWGSLGFKVGLIRPDHQTDDQSIQGYRQVMAEEGFPFEEMSPSRVHFLGDDLSSYFQALILPEGVNRDLTPEVARILSAFAARGGRLWIGQDAAAAFPEAREILAKTADLRFTGEPGLDPAKLQRTTWRIPAGSPIREFYDPQVFAGDELKMYAYPHFEDFREPVEAVEAQVLASGGNYPAIVQRQTQGWGWVLYMNARPGETKVRVNDDFLLRAPLKYFLVQLAGMPRLMGSPGGVGGLVLSLHVCSGRYIPDLEQMVERGLFYKEIPISFAITAGPDDDRPGDRKGFDAANPQKGGRIIQKIKRFGSIGSQGGWIHNLWGFEYSKIAPEQRRQYLELNFKTLESAARTRVEEYAAPGGAHSPDLHDELARLGAQAASIPSAFNSPPTRVWFNGRQEKRFWVFGYSGNQFGHEVENMLRLGRSPVQIVTDVADLFEIIARKREIRLFYSHPFELASRSEMWRSIQGEALRLIREGRLQVDTMGSFAHFLNRREKTDFEIRREETGYYLEVSNPEGLSMMTFALPTGEGDWEVRPAEPGHIAASGEEPEVELSRENGWTYLTIKSNSKEVKLRLVRE